MKTKQRGFTLIELLVVIAIIGILASVIGISIQNARVKGRDAKRAGDMRQMLTAMDQYYITHGSYPTGTGSVGAGGVALDDATAFDSTLEPMIPNYVPIIPVSPEPADGSCAGVSGVGGNKYWYETDPEGLGYTLTFCLGKETGALAAGIHFASPKGLQ